MKMILRIAPAVALLVATVGTTTLHADTFDRVAPQVVSSGAEGGPTVRVTNNYGRNVRVYVVDSHNRRRLLGRVGPSESKDLQIPAGLVRGTGTIHLKVYPDLPSPNFSANWLETAGIKTSEFSVQSDQVIELILEPDLTRSEVGIVPS
ncbi:MAG: hypothetical protein IH968_14135 [Gemmatimonadetes bacterium]|nr:hypothetical protein [Gemmatimonadota bacterium]